MTNADREQLSADLRVAEAPGGRPVLRAYRDTQGVWTIGFGTNLQELTINGATAEAWLQAKQAQSEHEASIRFAWYADLTPARQRAIVELVYNLGIPRLLGFKKFLAAMAAWDYPTARAELLDSAWAGQVGAARSGRIADLILHG